MKKYTKIIIGSAILLAFIIWTILVKTVDVKEMGVSTVGLATFNDAFLKHLPLNETLLKITDILMYSVIAAALVFAGIGVFQWIKRKSFKAVDKEIFVLGISYIVVIGLYFLFDKVIVINNRPYILPGDSTAEPSYPSSHTMTALFVFLSAVPMVNYLLKDKKVEKIIVNIALILLAVFTVVGRILSGAHWMSDIVGGILISIGLLYIFLFFFEKFNKKGLEDIKE